MRWVRMDLQSDQSGCTSCFCFALSVLDRLKRLTPGRRFVRVANSALPWADLFGPFGPDERSKSSLPAQQGIYCNAKKSGPVAKSEKGANSSFEPKNSGTENSRRSGKGDILLFRRWSTPKKSECLDTLSNQVYRRPDCPGNERTRKKVE